MICGFVLIAASPLLPYIVLLLVAPVVAVLLWLAFRLARSPQQRLTNLLCGGVGAVGAPLALVYLFEPTPNSWYENNLAVFVVGAMVAGAAMGALGVHATTDIWIGLASGRYILEQGEVPTSDPFSYTFAGEPFFNQNWLSHVAFFWVYDRIAPAAVVLLTWLSNAAIYGLVLYAVRVRCRSWP